MFSSISNDPRTIYDVFADQITLGEELLNFPPKNTECFPGHFYLREFRTIAVQGRRQCGVTTWIAKNAKNGLIIADDIQEAYIKRNPEFNLPIAQMKDFMKSAFVDTCNDVLNGHTNIYVDGASYSIKDRSEFYTQVANLFGRNCKIYLLG